MRMSLTKNTIITTLEKTAQYRGYKGLSLQSYMPIQKRREFNKTEQQQVDEHLGNLLPKIWRSKQTPIYELLASPTKTSLGIAGAGALAGGGLGKLIGGDLESAGKGALAGGLVAALPAILSYYRRNQINEDLLEQLRRLPEGSTIRDLEADPTYQADLNREAIQASTLLNLAQDYRMGKQAGIIGEGIKAVTKNPGIMKAILKNPETLRTGASAVAAVPYTYLDYKYITPSITQMGGGELEALTPKNKLEALLAYAANAASIRGFMGGKNINKVDWSKITEAEKARILDARGPIKKLTNWVMNTPYGRATAASVPLLASTAVIRGTANEQGVPLMGVVNAGRKLVKGVGALSDMAGKLSVEADPNTPGIGATLKSTIESLSSIPGKVDSAIDGFSKTWDTVKPIYGGVAGGALGGAAAGMFKSDPMLETGIKERRRVELKNKLTTLAGVIGGAGVGYGVANGGLSRLSKYLTNKK